MVNMVRRKRIEVLVDMPLAEWLVEKAAEAGIAHYSFISLSAGMGHGGTWRDEDVSGAVAKRIFLAIAGETKTAALIDVLAPHLDEYGLIVALSDVDVVRGDRF